MEHYPSATLSFDIVYIILYDSYRLNHIVSGYRLYHIASGNPNALYDNELTEAQSNCCNMDMLEASSVHYPMGDN